MIPAACNKKGDFRMAEGAVWHTSYHITYQSPVDLSDSISEVLRQVGASLNVFDPASLASRINRGETSAVDSNFTNVYNMSKRINTLTSGAFDPTLGPLITAWGFGKGHRATADTLRIDSLMQFVGIGKTKLKDGELVKEHPSIEFNFSAIAKGYGCDCIGKMFLRNGVNNFLVEIGGEIAASGKSPSGDDWHIGIDRPEYAAQPGAAAEAVVALTNRGMATSGNYRNFHGVGSERYGHTISSTTGRPARTDVLSATVIASTAMEADALATSMMAMGSERAIRLADSLRMPVMLVLADSTVHVTSGMKSLIIE